MLTDITQKGTLLFAFASVTLRKWFGKTIQRRYRILASVVSRKKQIVPLLEQILAVTASKTYKKT